MIGVRRHSPSQKNVRVDLEQSVFLIFFQVLKGLTYLREKHQIMHRGENDQALDSQSVMGRFPFHSLSVVKL